MNHITFAMIYIYNNRIVEFGKSLEKAAVFAPAKVPISNDINLYLF